MAHDINYSNFLTGITSALSKKHIKKDEARRYKLEHEHYVKLNRLARSQGGTVTLDIDENYYIASLSYSGKELILDKDYYLELHAFLSLLQEADTISIQAHDSRFTIILTFALHLK